MDIYARLSNFWYLVLLSVCMYTYIYVYAFFSIFLDSIKYLLSILSLVDLTFLLEFCIDHVA